MEHKKEITALFAAFKGESIDPINFSACINSIAEMTLPKTLTAVYVDYVYPIAVYLDWFNNFLTVGRFAEYYGLSESVAIQWIEAGRQLQENYCDAMRAK